MVRAVSKLSLITFLRDLITETEFMTPRKDPSEHWDVERKREQLLHISWITRLREVLQKKSESREDNGSDSKRKNCVQDKSPRARRANRLNGISRKEIKYRWNVFPSRRAHFFHFSNSCAYKERTLHHNGSIATTVSGTKTRWSSEIAFDARSSVFENSIKSFWEKERRMKRLNKQTKPTGSSQT